ncbi:MAG TPA: SH3 domain-containing protein [Anaerolineales bacterium]|nr:SH3 domain-containing protein [Anaerolineales bacterium]
MKRFWFKVLMGGLTVAILGFSAILSPDHAGAVQEVSTPTGILATVIYTEPINVRSGPSTVFYPIIGQLNPGDIIPALGVSPGREWVQISFAGGVNGTGWIYASFVTISGGELQIAEPPPTPTPLISATIDPTLAAAFIVQPTLTRMPTFTPPPPLEIPEFTDTAETRSSGAAGIFIVILVVIGTLGLTASFVLRK